MRAAPVGDVELPHPQAHGVVLEKGGHGHDEVLGVGHKQDDRHALHEHGAQVAQHLGGVCGGEGVGVHDEPGHPGDVCQAEEEEDDNADQGDGHDDQRGDERDAHDGEETLVVTLEHLVDARPVQARGNLGVDGRTHASSDDDEANEQAGDVGHEKDERAEARQAEHHANEAHHDGPQEVPDEHHHKAAPAGGDALAHADALLLGRGVDVPGREPGPLEAVAHEGKQAEERYEHAEGKQQDRLVPALLAREHLPGTREVARVRAIGVRHADLHINHSGLSIPTPCPSTLKARGCGRRCKPTKRAGVLLERAGSRTTPALDQTHPGVPTPPTQKGPAHMSRALGFLAEREGFEPS